MVIGQRRVLLCVRAELILCPSVLCPTSHLSSTDYKHIMRDDAMVTAGELGQKYESAEAYEDDFM